MPNTRPTSPESIRHSAVILVLGVLVLFFTGAARADQLWSVHAFGFKVGELRVTMQEDAGQYEGTGTFRTTGVAGILKRIHFEIRATGQREGNIWHPQSYSGDIDTGRRQSRTTLDFSGPVPRMISGEDTPATPIADNDLKGAIDPMTMTWLTLGASRDDPCAFDQTQFDGTRLTAIRFQSRERQGDTLTCHGVYDRLGGYTAEELAEITTSPVSITYQETKPGWRAIRLHIRSRHGPATLHRRD